LVSLKLPYVHTVGFAQRKDHRFGQIRLFIRDRRAGAKRRRRPRTTPEPKGSIFVTGNTSVLFTSDPINKEKRSSIIFYLVNEKKKLCFKFAYTWGGFGKMSSRSMKNRWVGWSEQR
jgi:hypothetical protein